MEEERYSKEELAKSERFKKRQDMVRALLKDDEEYSLEEAENILMSFMEGRV